MFRSTIRGSWPKRALLASTLFASMTVSYLGVSIWRHERNASAAARRATSPSAQPIVNPFASANGTHLIAFVVTASNCGWSKQPGVMEAMGEVRARLRERYKDSFARVSVVGVAIDDSVDAGLHFLSELGSGNPGGAFDQVVVGGSWLNEQVVRFVWREAISEAATPQVIVVARRVNTEAYLTESLIAVQDDQLVANPSGGAEILRWMQEGVPLKQGKGVSSGGTE